MEQGTISRNFERYLHVFAGAAYLNTRKNAPVFNFKILFNQRISSRRQDNPLGNPYFFVFRAPCLLPVSRPPSVDSKKGLR